MVLVPGVCKRKADLQLCPVRDDHVGEYDYEQVLVFALPSSNDAGAESDLPSPIWSVHDISTQDGDIARPLCLAVEARALLCLERNMLMKR